MRRAYYISSHICPGRYGIRVPPTKRPGWPYSLKPVCLDLAYPSQAALFSKGEYVGAGNPDWLKEHTDEELLSIANEMEMRAEQFNSQARQVMNDELRRRKLPLLGYGKSRY